MRLFRSRWHRRYDEKCAELRKVYRHQSDTRDWRAAHLDRATGVIRTIFEAHTKISFSGNFGSGDAAHETFWCEGCHTPWPCQTIKVVMDFGRTTKHDDYHPLRLVPIDYTVESGDA